MSAALIVGKAVADRYNGFTFAAPLPPLWMDEVPQEDSGGTATTLGWIVLTTKDVGTVEYMNALDRIEAVRVMLDVFDPDPATLKATVKGIYFNGSVPAARAGLDDAAALTLPTGYFLNKCERVDSEPVMLEGPRAPSAGPVYHARLHYLVELFIDGSLAS